MRSWLWFQNANVDNLHNIKAKLWKRGGKVQESLGMVMFSFHRSGELKYTPKDDEIRNRGSSASFQVTKVTHSRTKNNNVIFKIGRRKFGRSICVHEQNPYLAWE